MSIPFLEFVTNPFTAFNFAVEIHVPGVSKQVCNAAFSECDGLEMTMEVKTIREGGDNGRQIRLTGPAAFGTLTLKRGLTLNYDLWDWFAAVHKDPRLRADAEVVIFDPNGVTTVAGFVLARCVPVKLKAPALNAVGGGVAVEELQLAYESLALKKPDNALLSKLTGGLSEQFR
jgi:phage tail-like protein